jgi:hypothetical protein
VVRTKLLRRAFPLLLGAAALVLSACGGGADDGDGVASLDADAASEASDSDDDGALGAGIVAALLIGVVAGLSPATRAARLAPADAVRPM